MTTLSIFNLFQLANEGSGKENIKALINDLSELDISSGGIEIDQALDKLADESPARVRLIELEKLRSDDLISEDEYLQKRQSILDAL